MFFKNDFSISKLALILFVLTLTLFSHLAIAQLEDDPESPGYFYIPESRFEQDSQSSAIQITISSDTISHIRYIRGMQLVFETEETNSNSNGITIRVDSLATLKLLTRDGNEFGIGELSEGVIITATYDGTNFKADFNPRPHFRYVQPNLLSRTGNAYSITDVSIPPVATATILFGIKATATNTGNVTLSVNGSTNYPIFLSNGALIPAGALQEGEFIFCVFTTTGGVGFRAINLRPSRSLKGLLVATKTIPVGTHVRGFRAPWVLEAGITEVSLRTMPGGLIFDAADDIPNGLLLFPNDRFSDSHLGWFMEITVGGTSVYTRLELFGYFAGFGSPSRTNDGILPFLIYFYSSGFWNAFADPDINNIALDFSVNGSVTTTEAYVVNVYAVEN